MIIKVKDREPFELANELYINPDGWFKRTWLIESNWSNAFTHQFIIEGNCESDVIDELLDSKFGNLFKVSKEEIEELFNEWQKSDESDSETFNDWLAVHKDISFGGNNSSPYHSDMFLSGCINRCVVDGFEYEMENE